MVPVFGRRTGWLLDRTARRWPRALDLEPRSSCLHSDCLRNAATGSRVDSRPPSQRGGRRRIARFLANGEELSCDLPLWKPDSRGITATYRGSSAAIKCPGRAAAWARRSPPAPPRSGDGGSTVPAMRAVLVATVVAMVSVLRSRVSLHLEVLALRHQLAVLQEVGRRPRPKPADRLLWVWLSRTWSGWQDALVLVKPRTVISWQRARRKHKRACHGSDKCDSVKFPGMTTRTGWVSPRPGGGTSSGSRPYGAAAVGC
jgi:hypothetical protein